MKQEIRRSDNNEIAKNQSPADGYISILVYDGSNDIGSTRTTVTRKNKSQTRTAQNTTNNNSHGRFAFQDRFGKNGLKQSKQNRKAYNPKDSLYQVFGSQHLKCYNQQNDVYCNIRYRNRQSCREEDKGADTRHPAGNNFVGQYKGGPTKSI